MHTGYPSEPVLAEAALTFVDSMDTDLLSVFVKADQHVAGAIDKGERGENIGKMVLLLAYQAAVQKCTTWGHGCSLVAFLDELTGEDFTETVLASTPDNIAYGDKLRKAFKNSWVRFTHFARAADDSAMTSSMSWVAFVRGMAMIGWCSQQVVDVCIPVLLDKDKPIEESNMTAILVQFKSRELRTPLHKVAIRENEIAYFPPPGSVRDRFAKVEELAGSKYTKQAYRSRPYISC